MANSLLYGFMQLKDLAATRAITVDPDLMVSAIEMTMANHNDEVNRLLDLFSQEKADPQLQFKGSSLGRSQPLDENGRPRPIKLPQPYTVGFPIWHAGNRWGANFVTNAKMTVQQMNDAIGVMLRGDFLWIRDQLLAALFDSNGYTFADPIVGNVAVKGLANGDTVQYVYNNSGADTLGTETHYLAQANPIDNSNNPFPTIYNELIEHPGNGTEVLAFINSAQYSTVSALTNFVSVGDEDITVGANTARITGGLSTQLPARAMLMGKTDHVWIAQWNAIPANYIIAVAIGDQAPLVRRVDAEAELQGFRSRARIDHFPYYSDVWDRRMGFGGWNRLSALAYRIGNASWAQPTNYVAPIA